MALSGQRFEYGSIQRKLEIVASRNPDEYGFIYIDDVLRAFDIPYAGRFEANGMTLSSMRNDRGDLYHPERIPCRPDCIIQVIPKTPLQSSSCLSGSSIILPASIEESINQLNIKNSISTQLDSSEPLHVHLPRRLTAKIQEYMKVLMDSITTENRKEGSSDNPIIVERLLVECNKNMTNPPTTNSEFEKVVVRTLSSLFNQGAMTQQNVQKIFDQGTITQKIAQEVLSLQKQMNDRLILIEKKTAAILTQQLELAEYPIPRLFIVLPEEPVKYDPTNWFRTKFRLHFICECGKHTETKDSKISHHLHLAKHKGYIVREPTEFFKKYGPFLLLMLEMIKVGSNIAGHVVPALSTLKVIELTNTVKLSVDKAREMIDYSLECIDNQLTKVSESSPGDSVNAEPYAISTRQDLTDYLSDIEGLEGTELRQLGSFLKTSNRDNLLGNLYRMTTSNGHVKWVCRDHYRTGYQEQHIQKLRDVIKVAEGEYDRQLGKITIVLESSIAADEFYAALSKAKEIIEIKLRWKWKCTSSDFENLEIALRSSRVSCLLLEIEQFQLSLGDRLVSTSVGQSISRMMRHRDIKMIHLIAPTELIRSSTFTASKPSIQCKLLFQIKERETITKKEFEILSKALGVNSFLTTLTLSNNSIDADGIYKLSKALKSNTTLTDLGLSYNNIGDNGAQELSLILKSNSALVSLDLRYNFIGNNGAQSLSEALMINPTLKNLDLRNNIIDVKLQVQSGIIKTSSPQTNLSLERILIGSSGSQALSEAIKINSTLTTLNLEGNSIGDSGARTLSEALKINSTLTTLNLEGNSIGDSGAQTLSEALMINSTLTTLSLYNNSIGSSGAQALSEALKINSTLTTLNLEWNSIGSSGAQSLSEALKINSTLTTLNLNNNSIGDSGAQALSEALKINSALTTLSLEGNSIGSSEAQALSEALKITLTLTI